MSRGRTAAHYRAQGRARFAAGVVVAGYLRAPRSWQESARRDGYAEERDAWRTRCGPDVLQRGAYWPPLTGPDVPATVSATK